MLNFSRRISELLEQLDPAHPAADAARLRDALLWLTGEARSPLELDLIEAVDQRLSRIDVQAGHANPSSNKQRQHLVEQLLAGAPLRIALINDNGFYAGAGIAVARQARSFALAGHQVSVLALNGYPEAVLARQRYGRWLAGEGSKHPIRYAVVPQGELPSDRSGAQDPSQWILDQQQKTGDWDLVILGNLHSANISLRFLKPLLDAGTPLVWFAHDMDLLGGGCAYPQYHDCTHFHSGCNDNACPKPDDQYPTASNGRIRQHYLQRSQIFQHPGVQLATHSRWSARQLRERFSSQKVMELPLGVDTQVFRPSDEPAALRQSLGLDPHRFTVVVGADSLDRPGKGGRILQDLLPTLLEDPNLQVVCFGHYPEAHPHLINCGYLDDEAAIARVYACGDVFLNPVTIEAFGQTLLEASACGCIPISLKGTGVESVVHHQRTGLLCDQPSDLHAAVQRLQHQPELRRLMRAKAIETAQHRFSLHQQANIWTEQLVGAWAQPSQAAQPIQQPRRERAPRLSIVTTTLNCAEPLTATAATLAMQRDQDFEWVVQDGGSNDATAAVAEACGVNLKWQCSSDQGIYDALNQAFQRCRGDWILVLQAGDWLAGPNALHDLFHSVEASQHDILIASFNELSIDGVLHQRHPANPSAKLADLKSGRFQTPGPHWLGGMPCHQAILMRRPWCQRFPFDLDMRISADWLQLFEAIHAGARVGMSPTVLSWYPNGGYSFDNSQYWIENVIEIAKRFQPDHTAVDRYFAGALAEHTAMTQERKHQKLALQRWYPLN